MSQRVTIPFVGGTSQSKTIAVNNQSTVNLVNATKSNGAKSVTILEPAPGHLDRGAAGAGACRTPTMVAWDDGTNTLLYGVFGSKAVTISDTYVVTEIGTLENTSGIVRIARGRDFIMFVEGTAGWHWDGTTFTQITDADFPTEFTPNGTVTHVVYMDGFFIINHKEKDDFYISAKENPASWNALDFESASVAPDNSLALAATESILYIIGDETAQPYYNDGNPDFPYAVYLSGVQEVGIAAPQSIAESDDGVFWLATTPEGGLFVYRMKGVEGSVVSEEEQNDQLALEADPTTAYGFIYKQGQKSFYVLQLSNSTMLFNIKAGLWETREMANGDAWRAGGHGVIGTKNIIGARNEARIYELDTNTYDDAGDPMIRRRVSQIYHYNNMNMDWWQVVIEFLPGVGLISGTGSDPQCRFRYSDNNGKTWSAQLFASIGKIGEYAQRVVYNNLGQSRNRMLEVEVSDPINLPIINAYVVLEVLDD